MRFHEWTREKPLMNLARGKTLFAGVATLLLGVVALPACSTIAPADGAGKLCGVGAEVTACEDGQACELDKDCRSVYCEGTTCAPPGATSHSDGRINGGETGIDCGGSVKATALCQNGQGCADSTDCVGTCIGGLCGPISHTDGKKNLDESDVDCGGTTAGKCLDGKACALDVECVTGYCPTESKRCVTPRYDDGVKNGSESDVDCGGLGVGFKTCAEGRACVRDGDCNGACNYASKCVDAPSCKPNNGGDTCGPFDVAHQESCCKTLPVPMYSDPKEPGKTVYVDKYEITAGRMRAFVDAMSSANGGVPKIKDYTAAHRPARWNPNWELALPNAMTGTVATFSTTTKAAVGQLSTPGQQDYLESKPTISSWSVANGTWEIDIGLVRALNATHFFPEYVTGKGWPAPDYAASHDLNCSNGEKSYGFSTYWFDTPTIAAATGEPNVKGKSFSQDVMDQKALNCTPFGLYAAFCAWDGGQLMTGEVFDHLAGGPVVLVPSATVPAPYNFNTTPQEQPRMTGGRALCGGPAAPDTLNSTPDGTQACFNVWFYPLPPPGPNSPSPTEPDHSHDGSARIAPPGRVPADVVKVVDADEGWMDLKGNLVEAVLRSGETERFDYRGFGISSSSIIHHRNQQTTPRMKGGSFGARCMRFK